MSHDHEAQNCGRQDAIRGPSRRPDALHGVSKPQDAVPRRVEGLQEPDSAADILASLITCLTLILVPILLIVCANPSR